MPRRSGQYSFKKSSIFAVLREKNDGNIFDNHHHHRHQLNVTINDPNDLDYIHNDLYDKLSSSTTSSAPRYNDRTRNLRNVKDEYSWKKRIALYEFLEGRKTNRSIISSNDSSLSSSFRCSHRCAIDKERLCAIIKRRKHVKRSSLSSSSPVKVLSFVNLLPETTTTTTTIGYKMTNMINSKNYINGVIN